MRYLGIDFGLKKTGLAIGDDETKIASPLEVIAGGEETFAIVKNIIREEDIDGLVVGLPVPTQSENQNFKNVQSFIEKLEERLDLPVQIIDESYTSKESQRLRAESGTDVPEDALAAMMILQEYLDKRS